MKKQITADESLKLRALFVMARTHYDELRKYELAICNMIESEEEAYAGHFSDSIYGGDKSFEQCLKDSEIEILKEEGV